MSDLTSGPFGADHDRDRDLHTGADMDADVPHPAGSDATAVAEADRRARRRLIAVTVGSLLAVLLGFVISFLISGRRGGTRPHHTGPDLSQLRMTGVRHALAGTLEGEPRVSAELRTYHDSAERDQMFQSAITGQLNLPDGQWTILVLELVVPDADAPGGGDNATDNGGSGENAPAETPGENAPAAGNDENAPAGTGRAGWQVSAPVLTVRTPAGNLTARWLTDLPASTTGQAGLIVRSFSPPLRLRPGHAARLYAALRRRAGTPAEWRGGSLTLGPLGRLELEPVERSYPVPPGLRKPRDDANGG